LASLAWSPDGTQLAAGGSGGCICFAQLLDIHLEDGRVHATLDAPNHISVTDILSEAQEQLDFREPVVQVSLGEWGGWEVGWRRSELDGQVSPLRALLTHLVHTCTQQRMGMHAGVRSMGSGTVLVRGQGT
jgi:hypothetical protein